jgi:hypothetical protein
MPDYAAMYKRLFNTATDVIGILQRGAAGHRGDVYGFTGARYSGVGTEKAGG